MKYPYLLALAAVAIAASTGFSQIPVYIDDPSFETPLLQGTSDNYLTGAGTSLYVSGWTTVSDGDGYILVDSEVEAGYISNLQGDQFLQDYAEGASGGGTVSQLLTTSFTPGATYTLTAYAASFEDGPGAYAPQAGDTFFIADSSGTVLNSTTIPANNNRTFAAFTVSYTATSSDTGPIEIGFHSPARGSGDYGDDSGAEMLIDNFSMVASVPEPGSVAFMALGSFALLGLRRRRRALQKS